MKKVGTKVDYRETGIYHVNQVTERYFHKLFDQQTGPMVKAVYHSAFEICNVYTNQDSVLDAFQKLNGPQATNQVYLDHKSVYIPIQHHNQIRSNIIYNDHFNCHGFTFLNAQFWLELNNETVQIIIADDEYQACKLADLVNEGICLYYNYMGQLIHSARMVNGNLLSKFGINHLVTIGEEDILKRYTNIDYSRTLYYNPKD